MGAVEFRRRGQCAVSSDEPGSAQKLWILGHTNINISKENQAKIKLLTLRGHGYLWPGFDSSASQPQPSLAQPA